MQIRAALRRGEAVGLLPDQAPGQGEGRWSPAQVQERLLKAAGPDEAPALFTGEGAAVTALRAA